MIYSYSYHFWIIAILVIFQFYQYSTKNFFLPSVMIRKWKHILYGARISRKNRLCVCYSSWFGVCFIKPVLQGNINICILYNKIPFSTVVFFSFLTVRHLKKQLFVDAKSIHPGHSQLFNFKRDK